MACIRLSDTHIHTLATVSLVYMKSSTTLSLLPLGGCVLGNFVPFLLFCRMGRGIKRGGVCECNHSYCRCDISWMHNHNKGSMMNAGEGQRGRERERTRWISKTDSGCLRSNSSSPPPPPRAPHTVTQETEEESETHFPRPPYFGVILSMATR